MSNDQTNDLYTKAKKLINDFLDNEIKGNTRDEKFENLKKYSFWGIAGNKKYDGSGKFDGDRTKIIYAIDYLLYKDLPDFSIPRYSFNYNYNGETINTFNTLFSGVENIRNNLLQNFCEEDRTKILDETAIKNKKYYADDFYHVYQRLGNFMLLPCKTIDKRNLNTYRSSRWKDYFYPFMECLEATYSEKDTYTDKQSFNDIIKLKEKNSFYFNEKSFSKFVKDFYLDGYLDLQLKGYLRSDELNYDKQVADINRQIAMEYVEKATNFINKRTKFLVDKLQEALD